MKKPRPHHDVDAEASILGGVLHRPALLAKMVEVEVEDFVVAKHRAIWSAIRNLAGSSQPVDPVTVAGELARQGVVLAFGDGDGEAGAMAFCATLMLRCPSVDDVPAYVRTIQEHRSDRDARSVLLECVAAIDDADVDDKRGDEFIQWAKAQLGRLALRGATDTSVAVARIVADRIRDYDKITEARQRGVPLMLGMPTGIASLDAQIGGYPLGVGTLVAGRPGSGKSSVLRATADACSRANIGAHTFSLEDLRSRFADRVIGSESGVAIETLRTGGDIQRGEMADLGAAISRLYQRRHWLIDDGMMTATQIVARWRRRAEDNETKLVAVDYLGRIRKSDPRMTDFDHLVEAVTVLCDAAKDDKVALVLGAQLNRECEKRDDKRPQLSDIRGAGPIEEIVKCAIGVYRGAMYGMHGEGDEFVGSDEEWGNRMELIIMKHNDGACGRVIATWDGPTTTVS